MSDISLGPWPLKTQYNDNALGVINQQYTYAISEGKISGHRYDRVLGYNPDVNNTSETVWTVGGEYVFPTVPQQMEVVSSNAGDTSAGAGAKVVEIHYLDTSYTPQVEFVTLNGTTPVPTQATNILRINHFHVATGALALGTIDLRHIDNTPIYSQIAAGFGSAQVAVWTVPTGYTAYMTNMMVGAGSITPHTTEFRLRANCDINGEKTNISEIKELVIIQDNAISIHYDFPIKFPETVDIKVSVVSDAANAAVKASAHLAGWYEVNE